MERIGKETGKVSAADRAIDLKQQFRRSYGRDARIYRAPGRVNLIGEHTDYNDGFVMPATVGFSTWIALAPRDDRKLSIYSENFSELVEFDLSVIDGSGARPRPPAHWSDYVCGVAVALERGGLPSTRGRHAHPRRGADWIGLEFVRRARSRRGVLIVGGLGPYCRSGGIGEALSARGERICRHALRD